MSHRQCETQNRNDIKFSHTHTNCVRHDDIQREKKANNINSRLATHKQKNARAINNYAQEKSNHFKNISLNT